MIWTFHLKCHMVCLSLILLGYRIACLWFCNKKFVIKGVLFVPGTVYKLQLNKLFWPPKAIYYLMYSEDWTVDNFQYKTPTEKTIIFHSSLMYIRLLLLSLSNWLFCLINQKGCFKLTGGCMFTINLDMEINRNI